MIDIVLSLIYSSIHFIYFQQKEKILIFQQHTDSNFFTHYSPAGALLR